MTNKVNSIRVKTNEDFDDFNVKPTWRLPKAFGTLYTLVDDAHHLATVHNVNVEFEFNGYVITVNSSKSPDDTYTIIATKYFEFQKERMTSD